MSYRVAVCDDCVADGEYIRSIVKDWAEQYHVEFQLELFPSAEAFWFRYAEDKHWDILLLDIEMGKMDGVELAKQIRKDNDSVQIVFVTGFPDYVAEGYDVSALHYLMKPVSKDKLIEVLNKAKNKISTREKVLILPVDGELLRISLNQIYYIEACAHSVLIVTNNDRIEVKRSISEMENEVDKNFVRCHRSYLVNLKYISRLSKNEVVLDSSTVLPLSRGAASAVHKAFVSYHVEEQR